MSFADTQKRTWRDNILFSALVELTYRCNLNCSFCYNDTQLKGVPLSTAQYFDFFEDLRDLGTLNLTLTGGEPLAHPEFFALGRKARELDFLVRVKSNGHALRGALARRLKEEVDPFVVEISLHGASPVTHDRQTRVVGSFARLVSNVLELQALGMRMKLNCPVTLWNEHEIDAMAALADGFRLPIQFDAEITRRDDGDAAPLSIAPSRDGLVHLLRVEQRRAGANLADDAPVPGNAADHTPTNSLATVAEKHCGAGSSSITVDPYGNVYPCVQWRRRVGNLHDDSIRDLWTGSAELDDVRRLTLDVKTFVDRQQTPGFGFCPGLAEKESGRATHLYPVAQVMLDLRRRRPVN